MAVLWTDLTQWSEAGSQSFSYFWPATSWRPVHQMTRVWCRKVRKGRDQACQDGRFTISTAGIDGQTREQCPRKRRSSTWEHGDYVRLTRMSTMLEPISLSPRLGDSTNLPHRYERKRSR